MVFQIPICKLVFQIPICKLGSLILPAKKLISRSENVFFHFFKTDSADCATCEEALQNLEDIDDDADAVGVRMIKTDDVEFAEMIGLTEFPAIVYYEHGNPHIYDGKY
jgi:hypothetical protein